VITTVGWSSWRRDKGKGEHATALVITHWPVRLWLIHTLTDKACALTRHRLCNGPDPDTAIGRRLPWLGFNTVDKWIYDQLPQFKVEVAPEEIERLEQWRGGEPPYWLAPDDDDDDDEAADSAPRA
jgi:hypothetical protein